MSHWYIAKENELLLDLDDYVRPVKRYVIWGEIFRQRLRDAINSGKLSVSDVIIAESNTPEHFHVFIRLAHPMSLKERMVWQLRLASDWKRSHSDLMRAARGIEPASLLIRAKPVPGLWREPDEVCSCTRKHDTIEQMKALQSGGGCEVWKRLRGATPWELFGAPVEHEGSLETVIRLPVGRVPLDLILQVGELREGEF